MFGIEIYPKNLCQAVSGQLIIIIIVVNNNINSKNFFIRSHITTTFSPFDPFFGYNFWNAHYRCQETILEEFFTCPFLFDHIPSVRYV